VDSSVVSELPLLIVDYCRLVLNASSCLRLYALIINQVDSEVWIFTKYFNTLSVIYSKVK
jgi:phosphatidylserine/phosphatidylglycerophosphate/cardiolipin synthase-like enzyme